MSLARLALRLAAVEALCPAATSSSGPWPTIAENRIYDSRIDPIALAETPEDLAAAYEALEGKPVVVVYTEDDDLHPYTQKFDAAEYVVTLVIEIAFGARGTLELTSTNDAGEVTTTVYGSDEAQPLTDRQQEALIDLLDAQVRRVLIKDNRVPSAELYRKVAMETRQVHSDPQRASDRTLRLGLRTTKFHVKCKKEVWPVYAASPAPTGLDRVPEPLRSVALALPAGSSGRTLVENMVGYIAPAPTPPTPGSLAVDMKASLDGRAPTDTDFDVHASRNES